MQRGRVVGVAGGLVLAVGVAWLLLPSVDTGPAVADLALPKVPVRRPVPSVAEQPEVPDPPAGAAALPAPRAHETEGVDPPWAPGRGLAEDPYRAVARLVGSSEPTEPTAEMTEMLRHQATNRVQLYERMFYAAHLAIPEGEEAAEARAVLDDALDDLKDVADRVVEQGLPWKDAVAEMVKVRNAAGRRVMDLVDPEVGDQVRLRMGIAPEELAED